MVPASLITADEIREKQVLPRPVDMSKTGRHNRHRGASTRSFCSSLFVELALLGRYALYTNWRHESARLIRSNSSLIGMLSAPSTPIWLDSRPFLQKRLRRMFTAFSICWNLACSVFCCNAHGSYSRDLDLTTEWAVQRCCLLLP